MRTNLKTRCSNGFTIYGMPKSWQFFFNSWYDKNYPYLGKLAISNQKEECTKIIIEALKNCLYRHRRWPKDQIITKDWGHKGIRKNINSQRRAAQCFEFKLENQPTKKPLVIYIQYRYVYYEE